MGCQIYFNSDFDFLMMNRFIATNVSLCKLFSLLPLFILSSIILLKQAKLLDHSSGPIMGDPRLIREYNKLKIDLSMYLNGTISPRFFVERFLFRFSMSVKFCNETNRFFWKSKSIYLMLLKLQMSSCVTRLKLLLFLILLESFFIWITPLFIVIVHLSLSFSPFR